MFRVGCRRFSRCVCFILRAGPVLGSDGRIVHVVLSCGSPWWGFQAPPGYCRQLSVIVKSALIVWRVISIRSVYKQHISWCECDAGLSRALSAGAALQSIGVMREEGRLCWTQLESVQWWRSCLKYHLIIGELYRWSSWWWFSVCCIGRLCSGRWFCCCPSLQMCLGSRTGLCRVSTCAQWCQIGCFGLWGAVMDHDGLQGLMESLGLNSPVIFTASDILVSVRFLFTSYTA